MPGLICHWYLLESPRWFLGQNRLSEAETVLYYIAERNGYSYPDKLAIKLHETAVKTCNTVDSVQKLFRTSKLSKITIVLCYSWVMNGAGYYGLTLAAGGLGTDIYTGTALSGDTGCLPHLL